MTTRDETFGIGIGELSRAGVAGGRARPLALAVSAAATLGTYLAFRLPAQAASVRGEAMRSLVLDLTGLLLAGMVALPWYSISLAVARGEEIDLTRVLTLPRLAAQAVASFWFWAGALRGLRYLYGIPALVVLVLYAFHGFAVADGAPSGLRALGTSVRLGEGRRVGIFAIACLFLLLNLVGAIALGTGVDALSVAVTAVALLVTTNVTMVAGARLYLALERDP